MHELRFYADADEAACFLGLEFMVDSVLQPDTKCRASLQWHHHSCAGGCGREREDDREWLRPVWIRELLVGQNWRE
jgi:hypothetical protein